jgi:glutamate racemase
MRVAVFDSGIGGITVLKELRKRFPAFDFIYYGDTANVPYGTKSHSQIKSLVKAASLEIKKMNVDAMVIACNTAACIALDECKSIMGNTPVYSVVEAGITTISCLLQNDSSQNVLILGTKATVRSKTYSNELKKNMGSSIHVFEQECPLLVPMIEEGWIDHPILQQTVEEYIKPYIKLSSGIVFLACTHYPWIKNAFEKALPNWNVIDSAALVGEMLSQDSKNKNTHSLANGKMTWHFTDQEAVSDRVQLEEQIQF